MGGVTFTWGAEAGEGTRDRGRRPRTLAQVWLCLLCPDPSSRKPRSPLHP